MVHSISNRQAEAAGQCEQLLQQLARALAETQALLEHAHELAQRADEVLARCRGQAA